MKAIFFRALAVSAVLQFIITRQRAGQTLIEGEAEAMWLRYPFNVVLNALMWTLMLSALGAGLRRLRMAL